MKPLSSAPRWRAPVVACFVLGVSSGQPAVAQQSQPQASDRVAAHPSSDAPVSNPADASPPVFPVMEFAIEGNTVLPVESVEQAVTPFLGEGKTVADVEAARAALEKVYQDAGYLSVFVDLPEQRINEGVVSLKVLEGRVERLSVVGARYYAQGYIRNRVPELAEGKVPNFNVVQAQLAQVNRTDDRRVQPVLKPGRNPGTVDAELKVTDELPVHASIEINNNHAQFNKPWRVQAGVHYDNLFQREHSLSINAIVAPQAVKESKVVTASYAVPEHDGGSWLVSALWSDSQLEALGAATIVGKGFSLGLSRQWALPAMGSVYHTLTFGADYKDMKERTLVGSDQLSTPIRYMPFTLTHAGGLPQDDGALTTWNNALVFGFASLLQRDIDCGFGQEDQFTCKREGADGGFGYLRMDLRHRQPVGRWNLGLRVAGQAATQALIGAEQYALGGADSVRGYLAAEVVGDHALVASTQLNTPNLVPAASRAADSTSAWRHVNELNAYAFVDVGQVRVINPAAGQASRQSLGSTGLGLTARAFKAWSLTLDLAQPFKRASTTEPHDTRLHVRLGADF